MRVGDRVSTGYHWELLCRLVISRQFWGSSVGRSAARQRGWVVIVCPGFHPIRCNRSSPGQDKQRKHHGIARPGAVLYPTFLLSLITLNVHSAGLVGPGRPVRDSMISATATACRRLPSTEQSERFRLSCIGHLTRKGVREGGSRCSGGKGVR